ncbi:MAG: GNAT family N-acetyltransferase [Actinomycetota bacterium]
MSAECATRSTGPTCPPARLRVTPATSDDWIEIEAMLHDYLEWLRAVTGLEPTREQPRFGVEIADPQRAFAADDTTMLVARMATRQVGMVAVRRGDDGSAELKRLYVRPVARGRRIADLLVAEAIGTASRLGARSVWLETLRGVMDPAMNVYRRHGFEVVDQQSDIGHAGAVVMNRPLT